MNKLRSDDSLRYNCTKLWELRGNFNFKNSLVANDGSLLIDKEKAKKSSGAAKNVAGSQQIQLDPCSQHATHTAPCDRRVITPNHDGQQN